MKIVESYGPMHYEITGAQEDAAAKEFEDRYESLMRSIPGYPRPSEYIYQDLAALREEIEKKYSVEIR